MPISYCVELAILRSPGRVEVEYFYDWQRRSGCGAKHFGGGADAESKKWDSVHAEILVFSSGPSVSTFDHPLVSPAICSTVGPSDLPNMSSTATTEVPHFRVKLCFHDVSRSAGRWRNCRPNHVLLAPMLCADRTVTPRKQWLPCLVHTLLGCIFLFRSCLCVIFALVCCVEKTRFSIAELIKKLWNWQFCAPKYNLTW